jgi:diaminopropionate ammonia-lyase
LRELRGLASTLKVGGLLLKDEAERCGLNSFKILGVSYAVNQLMNAGSLLPNSVIACATEGNHGLALAHTALEHSIEAKIYVAADCAGARVAAIEREGAQVIRVEGDYDKAVKRAAFDAERHGWTIISDTSWEGYDLIPRLIMAGYTRLMSEAAKEWAPGPSPDVLIVQAGVGGLACAVVSWLCHRYGARRPYTIVCEPNSAASCLASLRAGSPVSFSGPFDTMMVGLRCGTVSPLAWSVLAHAADAFLAVDDEKVCAAMRLLAGPENLDPEVRAGAAGACGLGALLAILEDKELRPLREACGLDREPRLLLINTEGVTDPELYARVSDGSGQAAA